MARGLHGLERRRESPGEAQHRFAGLADRRRLQRVRTEVAQPARIGIHTVHRHQGHEARDVCDRVGDARAGVVVVGEPALGRRTIEGRVERDVEPIGERLIQVRTQRLPLGASVLNDSTVALHVARQEIARRAGTPGDVKLGFVVRRLIARKFP